ncbi:ribosomal subunit interface protein [Dehalogenimonas sp. WBC-2]|nr:ribosomal subunit interface protein [Dehalogenimonas sp. WBC-2]
MEIIITTKNLTLSESTRKQIERKLSKIGRHLPQARELRVEITEEATKAVKDRFVARAFLDVFGPVLNAEARAATLPTVIDQLESVISRQAQDFKTKGSDIDHDSPRFTPPDIVDADLESRLEIERYATKPMSLDEAMATLAGSNDDLLLFHNERGEVNLLRRQSNGGFKLVVSEAA